MDILKFKPARQFRDDFSRQQYLNKNDLEGVILKGVVTRVQSKFEQLVSGGAARNRTQEYTNNDRMG